MKIIDISQKLHNEIPVWPGDTPFQFQLGWKMEDSGSVNVGQVRMSTHTGTHIDAPFHFEEDGKRVADLPLERFIGTALVVDVSGLGSIGRSDLEHLDLSGATKLLLKTGAWTDRRAFPPEIPHLREDIAPYLVSSGIDLIGVEVPSVDPLDSKELPAHHALQYHNIQILEGIVLDHVNIGTYQLIALPLSLVEGDGCPVRAVLIEK
ncbi:arylformamidase [Falsibacillus albus]|uniref:Kynurenine formamidase n=1 Tax=Falsibacillus albus TaxID=2478915 RepID=A0A3L7JSP2_9BACI|nr:arylformamidase [Falsibacillus albus]RLQ93069.1 arylformamidase [Falsibacillus albus]